MMTDRELLELSAKAYGVELEYRHGSDAYYYDDPETGREQWIPTERDDQAFRLAVKLNLLYVKVFSKKVAEKHTDDIDIFSASRRAIVRAAAEVGKALKTIGGVA